MAEVDYDDDEIRRFVVRRYAFDPARRERRHVVVAVVDDQHEFERLFAQHGAELARRRENGEPVDPPEHVSGHVMEPGHLARAAQGHLVRRALEHGVRPERLRGIGLPHSMSWFVPDAEP